MRSHTVCHSPIGGRVPFWRNFAGVKLMCSSPLMSWRRAWTCLTVILLFGMIMLATARLIDWLTQFFILCSSNSPSIDWLIDGWKIDLLFRRLIDWLIDWVSIFFLISSSILGSINRRITAPTSSPRDAPEPSSRSLLSWPPKRRPSRCGPIWMGLMLWMRSYDRPAWSGMFQRMSNNSCTLRIGLETCSSRPGRMPLSHWPRLFPSSNGRPSWKFSWTKSQIFNLFPFIFLFFMCFHVIFILFLFSNFFCFFFLFFFCFFTFFFYFVFIFEFFSMFFFLFFFCFFSVFFIFYLICWIFFLFGFFSADIWIYFRTTDTVPVWFAVSFWIVRAADMSTPSTCPWVPSSSVPSR